MNRRSAPAGLSLAIAAALVTGATVSSAGVDVVSEARVASVKVIRGAAGTVPRVSTFSLPAVRPVVASGWVSARTSDGFNDSQAAWADDAFNGAGGPHYVEFDSGYAADIVDTLSASGRLVLAPPIDTVVVAGARYRVRRHATLAHVFGTNNQAGLTAGLNPSVADNVILYLPETQQTRTYFFVNLAGFTGWYDTTFQRADGTVIYPEQGVMVRRRVAADVALSLHGVARTRPLQVPLAQGFNLVGTLRARTAMTLASLGLPLGDPASSFASASNPSAGDNVILINPDGTVSTYFHSNFPGFVGWYSTAFQPAGQVPIQPGAAFFIRRRPPRGAINWTLAGEP